MPSPHDRPGVPEPGSALAQDAELVAAWAAAHDAAAGDRGRVAVRRRLTALLERVAPGEPVATATLGDHDLELLALCAQTAPGRPLDGAAVCPACDQALDVEIELPRALPRADRTVPRATLTIDGHALEVRVPTVGDLDAAVTADAADPVRALVDRIVVTVRRQDGADVDRTTLLARDDVVSAVDATVSGLLEDAVADTVALDCPECGERWTAWLDLEGFAWRAVDDAARTLLDEVDVLASAYGWTPDAVLGLPRAVRRHHLAHVS